MPSDPLNIHIDLSALQATFFRRLQHQLDVIKVLQVGCELVTAKQVAEQPEFGAFVPANGAQLKHEDAKAEAQDWLLRLRQQITFTSFVRPGSIAGWMMTNPGSLRSTKRCVV